MFTNSLFRAYCSHPALAEDRLGLEDLIFRGIDKRAYVMKVIVPCVQIDIGNS